MKRFLSLLTVFVMLFGAVSCEGAVTGVAETTAISITELLTELTSEPPIVTEEITNAPATEATVAEVSSDNIFILCYL